MSNDLTPEQIAQLEKDNDLFHKDTVKVQTWLNKMRLSPQEVQDVIEQHLDDVDREERMQKLEKDYKDIPLWVKIKTSIKTVER